MGDGLQPSGRELNEVQKVPHVSRSLPQSEKLVPYISLLTIRVLWLCKPYTKIEEGTGLELSDVYWRLVV